MQLKETLSELNNLCESSFDPDADITTILSKIDELFAELNNINDIAWIGASIKQSVLFNHLQAHREHASQKLKDKNSTVYLLRGHVTDHYKIGVSTNLSDRLRQVNNGTSEKIQLVASSLGGRKFESYLHERYKHKKIKGEWFFLSDNDVNEIKALMEER